MKKRTIAIISAALLMCTPMSVLAENETGTGTNIAAEIENAEELELAEVCWELNHPEMEEGIPIVSVLGDSMSTYKKLTEHYYYITEYSPEYISVDETWWGAYIKENGYQLGTLDGLGSSRVSFNQTTMNTNYSNSPVKCMASEERIANLGKYGTPDVILFFGGTNDLSRSVMGTFDPDRTDMDISTFANAYQTAILRMKQYYPDADIICLTPFYWWGSTREKVDTLCSIILEITSYYGVKCVDLRKAGITNYTDVFRQGDSLAHPNKSGFAKIYHYLQYGEPALNPDDNVKIPKLDSTGIYVIKTSSDQFNAGMCLTDEASYIDTTFDWKCYNDFGELVWSLGSSYSNWVTIKTEAAMNCKVVCTAQNMAGETVTKEVIVPCTGTGKITGTSIVNNGDGTVTFSCTSNVDNACCKVKIYNKETGVWFYGKELENGSIVWETPTENHFVVRFEAYTSEGLMFDRTGEEYTYSKVPFTDVSSAAWYYDAVKYVFEKGLMTGTGKTTFAPGNILNRAQLVQILYNAEKRPLVEAKACYSDVQAGAWYVDAIAWATENGIVKGYANGTFKPSAAVSRQETAIILKNYAEFKGYQASEPAELDSFLDAEQVSDWAAAEMKWAVGAGILNGKKGGTLLDPRGVATRCECAQLMMNFFEKMEYQTI